MASFLAGPAAELVGMGMQAVGVGIPVNSSAAKLIDGVRGLGLPVPPKSWFKNKSKSRRDYEEEKKTVYDKLESHVNGVIQVVKPVIELKQMVREGCCRSADRDSRRRDRSQSPRNELTYYTPQKCTSGSCMFSPTSRDSVSPKKNSKKACKNGECNSGGGSRRWKSRNDSSSDEEASCMYCSRSRSLMQLPCGRMICSKCDKTENHDLECKQCKKLAD